METAVQPASANGQLNQNFLKAGKKDEARGRPVVRMKVHNRDALNLPLAGANIIGPGTHVIVCYDDEVDAIRDQVEDPQKIAQAEQQYAIDIAEQVGKGMEPQWAGKIEDLAAIIASKSDPAVNELYAKISRTTGASKQGAFQKLFKRSMKPLAMAELVVGSEHAEPQREGTQREVEKQAEAFAMALDKVLAKYNTAPSAAQIQAMVAEQLEQQLGGKAGPKR